MTYAGLGFCQPIQQPPTHPWALTHARISVRPGQPKLPWRKVRGPCSLTMLAARDDRGGTHDEGDPKKTSGAVLAPARNWCAIYSTSRTFACGSSRVHRAVSFRLRYG